MRTISQVAKQTGISTRALQYYDEIGLLKPSSLTQSGYRLYDDEALQKLQQILFFKELGFALKDIGEMLQKPEFDRIAAFQKQKELLLLKRSRIDRLIRLLDRLEKGEPCMSFQEFDLSEYIHALEDFKRSQTEEVIRHWGSAANFDRFIQKIRDNESEVAKLAIQQFGSVEQYTAAMKDHLEHFSERMETQLTEDVKEIARQSELLYGRLTADLSEEVSSPSVQSVVRKILRFIQENSADVFLDKPCIQLLIDTYSNDLMKPVIDSKYKTGASDYIVKAFRYYAEHNAIQPN